MPILVKHSGNAAPSTWGAYGAGQGKRYAEDSRIAGQNIERRKAEAARMAFQESQANADRQTRANELRDSREFSAEQADKVREFSTTQADTAYDRDLERLGFSADMRDSESMAAQQRGRDDIEWGYTAKQKAEFAQKADAYQAAVDSGEFTPDELKEIHNQVIGQMAGIRKLPSIKKESPWPAGQGVGETWSSADGKFVFGRDDKGNIRKLAETNAQPTKQDRIKAYEIANRMATGFMEGVAPDSRPIKAIVAEILGEKIPLEELEASDKLIEESWDKQIQESIDNATKMLSGNGAPDMGPGIGAAPPAVVQQSAPYVSLSPAPEQPETAPAADSPSQSVAPIGIIVQMKDGTHKKKIAEGRWETIQPPPFEE